MIVGPVFWMEMRTAARQTRHYLVRAFFVSVVFAVTIITWLAFHSHRTTLRAMYGMPPQVVTVYTPLTPHELPVLGRELFAAYSVTQFMLIVLLAPLYTAGAIAADRERRVLELVFMTDLRNSELVASKFLTRTIHLCAMAVSGIPVMYICLLLGGVGSEDLLATVALTLTTLVFVCSLGLLISIGSRRAYGAIILLYLILLIVWVALPLIAGYLAISGGLPVASLRSEICLAIVSLNPLVALLGVVSDRFVAPGLSSDAVWYCSVFYSVATLLLMVLNLAVIRKFGLWASRERVVRDKKRDRQRRTRRVWSNPVTWREVKTIAIHRRMRWARILCLIFSFMVSALMWVGWIADWLQSRRAMSIDIHGVSGIVATTATVAWILMALQGAVSFSHEREHSTLDALLTTPLPGSRIVAGKLQGILRSSAFAVAFPIAFILLAYFRDVTSARAAALSIAIVFLVGMFAAGLGLGCSVRFGSSGKACGLAAGIMLVLCLGLPIAAEMFIRNPRRSDWYRVTFASPSLNLAWAVTDERLYHDVYYGYRGWDLQVWETRFGKSVGHIVLELTIAAFLVAWSIRHIESDCRVAQRRSWLGLSKSTDAPAGSSRAFDETSAGRCAVS